MEDATLLFICYPRCVCGVPAAFFSPRRYRGQPKIDLNFIMKIPLSAPESREGGGAFGIDAVAEHHDTVYRGDPPP
jgi:hypothetical protein